jgi:hypothetical protein
MWFPAVSQTYKTFFSSSLTNRPNKLQRLFLESLSSQVFNLQVSAGAYPEECLSKVSLVLPAKFKARLEMVASDKHTSLFGLLVSDEEKSFKTLAVFCIPIRLYICIIYSQVK